MFVAEDATKKNVIGAVAKHIKHLEGGCKEHLVVAEQTPSSSASICTSPDNNILAIPTRGRVRANLATWHWCHYKGPLFSQAPG